jgi:hypothetical protein
MRGQPLRGIRWYILEIESRDIDLRSKFPERGEITPVSLQDGGDLRGTGIRRAVDNQKAMTEGGAGNGEHACELAASEYAYRCHV